MSTFLKLTYFYYIFRLKELKEQLRWSKSEHADFKNEIDQRLFQTKLELKTTQQLYNDTAGEKERYNC